MATNKQREASRRLLEQQLRERQAREASRKRATLIGSIIGTLVLIVVVVIIIAVATSGGGKKKPAAGPDTPTPSTSSPSPTPTTSPVKLGTPKACAKPAKGTTASYAGVTVGKAKDLTQAPTVTSKAAKDPTALSCEDLVVGKGAAATPTSTVTVQYTGVLYKNGTQFDSSWSNGGKPISFSLKTGPGGVIAGFGQGIGGTGKLAPMRVGGRRIIVMPTSLAYGATGSGSVPPNASLVFVVDLVKITAS